ncbi:glycosyl hydrolase family 35, partial [Oesophagostomum dentatum]
MRTSEEGFKEGVEKWFAVLLPKIKPLLRQNDGPVLMIQVENEYGSYSACDRNYTSWLRDLIWSYLGNETVLYTTWRKSKNRFFPTADGGSTSYLKCGVIPDVLATVDFGPTSEKNINSSFAAQKKYLPKGHGPLVNSEFYPGWLVLWGQKSISIPSPEDIVKSAK